MKNSFDIEDLDPLGEHAETPAGYVGSGSDSFLTVG